MAFAGSPDVLPRNFDVEAYARDMASLETLRRAQYAWRRLHERPQDTGTALGSDLMTNSLECYAVLKVAGKGAASTPPPDAVGTLARGGRGHGASAVEASAVA